MGMGMGGRMMPGGTGEGGATSTTTANALEEQFVTRINGYLWIAGFISIAAAFVLGLIVTRQITQPIYELKEGATRIAGGNLDYRVNIRSKDEFGDLANSFNQMATSLKKDEEMRRRLITDISHELRTPLTVIDGTVTAIEDGVFAPNREHLDTIKEQTTMLTRLVTDLRDLSLAESGQLKLDRTPTDMADFLRRKLTQFEAKAWEKHITLQLDATLGLPLINIDRFRIDQVVTNLLANALTHTPNSGSIKVGLKNVVGAGNSVSLVVSIADTGEGIPPEHLPHMFERFYRVESARSRTDGGAGLGLAIVKQMVLAHGGTVRVESEIGKGSTFYITLPMSGG
jgi:signal transduction histidine kinase